jgi:flagellar biosynthesis protein FlhG
MSDQTLAAAFKCLGVLPGDGPIQVERAYLRLKNLYTEDALATYSLFETGERQARLERIEEAYREITENRSGRQEPIEEKFRTISEEILSRPANLVLPRPELATATPPVGPPVLADPRDSPGRFLKESREQAGISLQEVAARLKLRVRQLEQIEAEQFDLLPPAVYLQGFVGQYAKVIGLREPGEIVRLYLERFRAAKGT